MCCKQECNSKIPQQLIIETCQHFLELTKQEQDLIILGHLDSNRQHPLLLNIYQTQRSRDHATRFEVRETHREGVHYYFRQIPICQAMYFFVHDLGSKRYKNIVKHFDASGLTVRTHKLMGRTPTCTTRLYTREDINRAVQFLRSFAERFAIPLPGRLPSVKDFRVMRLPSAYSKAMVHRQYEASCKLLGKPAMERTRFLRTWKQYCPDIASMKPANDLCNVCQTKMALLRQTVNDDVEKRHKLQEAMDHLNRAAKQCEFYQRAVERAQRDESVMVLSFDYAQTVHYPSSPQSVGKGYFLANRKIELFGIVNEGERVQHTYIIDESHHAGKGANAVISMLHDYLQHKRPVDTLILFCDNTVGQNKNNAMLHYLAWRIDMGLNKEISLNFLLVGHTKFAPDRMFGLIKLYYRRCIIDTFQQFIECVAAASPSGHVLAVPTMFPNKRSPNVIWNEWTTFLKAFYQPCKKLTTYHHFLFTSERTDVGCKEFADSAVSFVDIKKGEPIGQPDEITPPGLSLERRWYLFTEVRPLCSNPANADHFMRQPSKKPHKAGRTCSRMRASTPQAVKPPKKGRKTRQQ